MEHSGEGISYRGEEGVYAILGKRKKKVGVWNDTIRSAHLGVRLSRPWILAGGKAAYRGKRGKAGVDHQTNPTS